jgi:hypothetical protein
MPHSWIKDNNFLEITPSFWGLLKVNLKYYFLEFPVGVVGILEA